MNKAVFILCTICSSFSFAGILTCDVVKDPRALGSKNEKVQIAFTRTQVETIDLIKMTLDEADSTSSQRIYSRTYSDSSNRGGYKVSYCNPDENQVSEESGISIYSHCKAANSSDDVMFSAYLNDELQKGKITIDFLGKDIVRKEISLHSCK